MSGINKSPDITQRLHQAIEKLHEDVQRVEVWAGALSGFTKPIPQYVPNDDHLLSPAATEEASVDSRKNRSSDPL
jgi:hypothetical protein